MKGAHICEVVAQRGQHGMEIGGGLERGAAAGAGLGAAAEGQSAWRVMRTASA